MLFRWPRLEKIKSLTIFGPLGAYLGPLLGSSQGSQNGVSQAVLAHVCPPAGHFHKYKEGKRHINIKNSIFENNSWKWKFVIFGLFWGPSGRGMAINGFLGSGGFRCTEYRQNRGSGKPFRGAFPFPMSRKDREVHKGFWTF